MMRIQAVGFNKTQVGLKRAIVHLENMVEPIGKSIKVIEGRAKSTAPMRTGKLRSSITSHVESPKSGVIESRLPYANPIHWGWSRHSITENMYIVNPARETELSIWLEFFHDHVEQSLDEVAS